MEFGKQVRVREEKFGSVVFETLREKVYVTNETGKEILKLLQGKKDAIAIAEELSKKYDCSADDIMSDVNEYIACLKTNNVVL